MPNPVRRRKVVAGGARRTVATTRAGGGELALDDRPLGVQPSRDRKWLIVSLPHELWVVDTKNLEFQRSFELSAPHPTVTEGMEGSLWIGGPHLRRASLFGGSASKVGSKLSGVVEHITMLRNDLLCGVGPQGEVLLDTETMETLHRRKAGEKRHEIALTASADEKAVFCSGGPSAWVLDPDHPSGYTKLHFKGASDEKAPGIVCVGLSTRGRCILAAADGGVAWTTTRLRLAGERFPQGKTASLRPLDVCGDGRWIYVLRSRGRLQRFLVEQLPEPKKGKDRNPAAKRPADAEPEYQPLPEAQEVMLGRSASCMTILEGETSARLILGGPHADGQLGKLWATDPEQLDWQEIPLGARRASEETIDPDDSTQAAPFVATRNKVESGTPLAQLEVDRVLSGNHPFFLVRSHGSLLERPVALERPDKLMPGDALLLPAMLRLSEGTARPGLLLWPGLNDSHRDPLPLTWLTWGDKPRAWIPLDTPHIREQRWGRRDVFPLQTALHHPIPEAPGNRARVQERWVDKGLFEALAQECKHQLKVLW